MSLRSIPRAYMINWYSWTEDESSLDQTDVYIARKTLVHSFLRFFFHAQIIYLFIFISGITVNKLCVSLYEEKKKDWQEKGERKEKTSIKIKIKRKTHKKCFYCSIFVAYIQMDMITRVRTPSKHTYNFPFSCIRGGSIAS